MSEKENVTLNLDPDTRVLRPDSRVLRDDELDAVSGGKSCAQGTHYPKLVIQV